MIYVIIKLSALCEFAWQMDMIKYTLNKENDNLCRNTISAALNSASGICVK